MSYGHTLRVIVLISACAVCLLVAAASAARYAEAAGPTRAEAVKTAREYLGTPYEYGGTTRKGMDCSGLVYRVFRYRLGMEIPRTARDQWRWSGDIKRVSLNDTKPGDLVFSDFNRDGTVDHVGIAAERDGRILQINATVPGERVKYTPIYREYYVGSKRWLRR